LGRVDRWGNFDTVQAMGRPLRIERSGGPTMLKMAALLRDAATVDMIQRIARRLQTMPPPTGL